MQRLQVPLRSSGLRHKGLPRPPRIADDFTPLIKRWLRKFYNQYHRFPAYWRLDSGGEFLNHELIEFFDNKGIEYKFTTTNAKNQNATSERKIGVIWTATLKSLAHSGVPMQFRCYCAI